MKTKCCHNPRYSGLKYCKNDANVSLFLRGFTYDDFEDKCDRARYCIECAVELIGDKPENFLGFLFAKEIKEYNKFIQVDGAASHYAREGYVIVDMAHETKFLLQQLAQEELQSGIRFTQLADQFDGTSKSTDEGRLWAPLYMRSERKTPNSKISTSNKVRHFATDILRPIIERTILPHHYFSEKARANYLVAIGHKLSKKIMDYALNLGNINMLPKRQSLNHRQSLHSDALSPNVVVIIPLLSETNGYPLHIIPRSHDAIFEIHHDPNEENPNAKHRHKRSRRRRGIVRVRKNNNNNEIFGDLIVPGTASVKQVILQKSHMIIFNETTIHSGSKPGILIPHRIKSPLFKVLKEKLNKDGPPSHDIVEFSMQLSFSLFNGNGSTPWDPSNAHPLWIKDETIIHTEKEETKQHDGSKIDLQHLIENNGSRYGTKLTNSYKMWELELYSLK